MTRIIGWKTSKVLDAVSKIKAGGTPSRSNPNYWRGEIPFVLIEDMTNTEKFLFETKEKITRLGLQSSSAWIVPENSILLSMYATLGKVVINKIPVATNQAILGMIPGEVDRDFLFYLLQFSAERLSKLNSQTTQKNLNKQIVSNFEVTYPTDPAEQRAIADILSTVDEAIAQSEALVRKYQSIKQGLMFDLLTPKKDWQRLALGIACGRGGGSIQTGPFGSQLHSSDYQEEGIPIITVEHLSENGIIHSNLPLVGKEDYKRLQRYKIIVGDLVFSRVGAIDRCAYVSEKENGWLFSGRCLRVRPGANFDPRFLSYQLNHYYCRQWILNNAVGSTMKCLNTKILSNLPVYLPRIEEQKEISEILTNADNAIGVEQQELGKLILLKQGLMQDLLSGQVRVKV
jgi:type I restriction enzyme S subunit